MIRYIANDIKIGGDFDERFSFEDFSYNNDNFWHIWFKYASVSFHYCPIY